MASALRTASWVLLVIVGGLTVLGSMASCAVALRGVRDPIVSSITIDDLSAGRPEIAKALRARRLTAAAYAAAFGVMVIVVAAVPYRRGEVWAWWAILAGALAVSLPILARVPFIETRTGAGTGLLTLVVVLVALLLDIARLRGGRVAPALVLLLLAPPVARAETVRFKPTVGHPTFARRPAVLTVKPGDVLESESLWGEWYERAGGKWPGEVGPIAIEGAEPGDTLAVEILKVRPNHDTAVSTQGGRFGALVPDYATAMLNETFPRGRYVWRLDRQAMTGTIDLPGSTTTAVTVPLRPMLGRVATAPPGEESWDGLWPGAFGGNMDDSDVREGTTVYLPVFQPGALFYFGDGHALQGDGEVCGSGLETSMDVAFRFGLLKKKTIAWPRLEDGEYLMVAGSARPLSDALRISFVELVGWLVADYGFDKADAYQLVSQTATIRVANMVDPLYTVVAKFPKRLLPAR